ncbi:MAG: hypothetical protein KJ737_09235 [Proteobacteria bacterium]|nr:hypothetical protein [Pseudomonadota bacterium]
MLSLSIYQELSELAFLQGDYRLMDKCADIVNQNARSVLDQTNTLCTKIFALRSQADFVGAIRTAVAGIQKLGIDMPDHPDQEKVIEEFGKAMKAFSGKTDDDLLNLKIMSDPRMICFAHLLDAMGPAAYIADQNMFVFSVLRALTFILNTVTMRCRPWHMPHMPHMPPYWSQGWEILNPVTGLARSGSDYWKNLMQKNIYPVSHLHLTPLLARGKIIR